MLFEEQVRVSTSILSGCSRHHSEAHYESTRVSVGQASTSSAGFGINFCRVCTKRLDCDRSSEISRNPQFLGNLPEMWFLVGNTESEATPRGRDAALEIVTLLAHGRLAITQHHSA
jgi:hypothetical protein